MLKLKDLITSLEKLTGESLDVPSESSGFLDTEIFTDKEGLGYSQFNEILLLFGIDRITKEFFQFLCNGKYVFDPSSSIKSIEMLNEGIDAFTELALLFYGNIKFAFKKLSKDKDVLKNRILLSLPNEESAFNNRHAPLEEVINIPPEEACYLGYFREAEIGKRLIENQNDQEAREEEEKRLKIVEIGKKNDVAYLASDHMDIYVATSMRRFHEFVFVSEFVKQLNNHKNLIDLNLRIFNPTLSYCYNRVDKGLSEALMLKRAKCTIYLAQEYETLGKDSELASTLAQGKVVIAFVPKGNKKYTDNLLSNTMVVNKGKNKKELIIDLLRIFNPDLAWKDEEIQRIIANRSSVSTKRLINRLYEIVENYYDNRATDLKERHPLGIQVNLRSGVANGVLVARSIHECVMLIREIMLNTLSYKIERDPSDKKGKVLENYIYLKEARTNSIYRVKTGNELLTNSFWNFYTNNINSDEYEYE